LAALVVAIALLINRPAVDPRLVETVALCSASGQRMTLNVSYGGPLWENGLLVLAADSDRVAMSFDNNYGGATTGRWLREGGPWTGDPGACYRIVGQHVEPSQPSTWKPNLCRVEDGVVRFEDGGNQAYDDIKVEYRGAHVERLGPGCTPAPAAAPAGASGFDRGSVDIGPAAA
jgi:hypothetical protein